MARYMSSAALLCGVTDDLETDELRRLRVPSLLQHPWLEEILRILLLLFVRRALSSMLPLTTQTTIRSVLWGGWARWLQSRACLFLEAERRWAVTGTPIQNSLDDAGALLMFLRHEPWSDRGWWRKVISDPYKVGIGGYCILLMRHVLPSGEDGEYTFARALEELAASGSGCTLAKHV